jgi:Family of unknown function (DUF5701)
MSSSGHELGGDLDRQLRNLHDLGYPALAGVTAARFEELVEPLRDRVGRTGPDAGGSGGHEDGERRRIPCLLVVRDTLVPTAQAVGRWCVRGRSGWTDMAAELPTYHPVDGVDVPGFPVYLVLDVDTGADTLGVTPDDALPTIQSRGRTPLTIDEGVALVTHFPEVFSTHNAFQALGSRAGNRRVPSFWVSKGAPRLGWCWAGNPHSWLGAASAAGRV